MPNWFAPPPQAEADPHAHRVTVMITLACGHTRAYPMSADSVAQMPTYARPGILWHCQSCRPGFPGKRPVVSVRHLYGCQQCEATAPDVEAPAGNLPAFHPFDTTHRHGLYDTVGYVIVRATRPHGVGIKTADVAHIPGGNRYAYAVETQRALNEAEPDAAHVIVCVYRDGCRSDW